MDAPKERLETFISLIGRPYSAEIDGVQHPTATGDGHHRVSVTIETEVPGSSQGADHCRWDCFGLVDKLEATTFEILSGPYTARLAAYNRAVQELQSLISCVAARQSDGTWELVQICCRHEPLFIRDA